MSECAGSMRVRCSVPSALRERENLRVQLLEVGVAPVHTLPPHAAVADRTARSLPNAPPQFHTVNIMTHVMCVCLRTWPMEETMSMT